ncbi:hypothetical protein [Candidatus Proelusimicrobium volucris]|uniref:hypothetical protein n=1 Tax=Candidatus Proelusimicrobium volucris TaxID=3416225 RepID=UPI003D0E458A
MFKRIFFAVSALILCFLPLRAMQSDTYLIDTPTAEVLPLRDLSVRTRIFTGGGVLAYFDFTVINRLSIGASLTAEHLVGESDEDIKLLVPALQLKYRLYDGGEHLPALAIGFDNQGFKYNHDLDEYEQPAKGLYLAFSKEILIPGLLFNPGLNVTVDGFEFDKLAGYVSAAYNIKDIVNLMFEWDNIHGIKESRLNGGLRLYITENFSLDFAVRNFNHKAERIAQFKYSCSI